MKTPNLLVRFVANEDAFLAGIRRHLASGDLTPDHLVRDARISDFKRYYVPVHRYQGTFTATWAASFGYDRWEKRTVMRYNSMEKRNEPHTENYKVTDWRPASGTATGDFDVPIFAGDNSGIRSTSGAVELVGRASKGDTILFEEKWGSYATVEQYDPSEIGECDELLQPHVKSRVKHAVERYAQGDHQKGWTWNYNSTWDRTTVLAPVHEAVVQFEGHSFRVYGNGLASTDISSDPLPVDHARQRTIYRGYWPMWAGITAGVLAMWRFDGSFWAMLGATALGLTYGMSRAKFIVASSKARRQSFLHNLDTAGSSPPAVGVGMDAVVLTGACLVGLIVPFIGAKLPQAVFEPAQVAKRAAPGYGPQYASQTPVQAPAPAAVPAPAPTPEPKPAEVVAETTPNHEYAPNPVPGPDFSSSHASAVPVAAPSPWTESRFEFIRDMLATVQDVELEKSWALIDAKIDAYAPRGRSPRMGDRIESKKIMAEGLEAWKKRDADAAITLSRQAVELDPSYTGAFRDLASMLKFANRKDEGVALLLGALLSDPTNPWLWYSLSELTEDDPKRSNVAMQVAMYLEPNRALMSEQLSSDMGNWSAARIAYLSLEKVPLRGAKQPS